MKTSAKVASIGCLLSSRPSRSIWMSLMEPAPRSKWLKLLKHIPCWKNLRWQLTVRWPSSESPWPTSISHQQWMSALVGYPPFFIIPSVVHHSSCTVSFWPLKIYICFRFSHGHVCDWRGGKTIRRERLSRICCWNPHVPQRNGGEKLLSNLQYMVLYGNLFWMHI